MEEKEPEIWKDIINFEGKYQISSLGNVKSLSRKITNYKGSFMSKEKKLKKFIDEANYPYVRLFICRDENKKQKSFKAFIHRLIAQAFIPNPNNYPLVLHNDDNTFNYNISNLRWGTASDNMQDKIKRNRANMPKGENHPISKLTEKQIIEIREKYIPFKYSTRKLAKEYGVVQGTICFILKKRNWKHI